MVLRTNFVVCTRNGKGKSKSFVKESAKEFTLIVDGDGAVGNLMAASTVEYDGAARRLVAASSAALEFEEEFEELFGGFAEALSRLVSVCVSPC